MGPLAASGAWGSPTYGLAGMRPWGSASARSLAPAHRLPCPGKPGVERSGLARALPSPRAPFGPRWAPVLWGRPACWSPEGSGPGPGPTNAASIASERGAAVQSGRSIAASGCWPWSPGPAAGLLVSEVQGPACPGAPRLLRVQVDAEPRAPARCILRSWNFQGPQRGRSWLASAESAPSQPSWEPPTSRVLVGSRLCSNTGRSYPGREGTGISLRGGDRFHAHGRHRCTGGLRGSSFRAGPSVSSLRPFVTMI